MNNELLSIISYLERDRGVNREIIIQAIESAIQQAARKSLEVSNDLRVEIETAYDAAGMHAHPFPIYEPPIRQTARFCGMRWLDPIIVHGAHKVSDAALHEVAATYRARLEALR